MLKNQKKAWGLGSAIGPVLVLVFVLCGNATAQDFSALLTAVEKMETNLKQLVEQEKQQRTDDIARLQAAIGEISGSTQSTTPVDLSGIEAQIAELQGAIAKQDGANAGQAGASEEQLTDVMVELLALRVEVQGLKRSLNKNATQLASLDADGWATPGTSDDQVDQLAQQFADLNENVDKWISSQSYSAKKSSAKPSASKTTVNGRLYSHGMVDFADDGDNYNEFALSRAYVTLKSKLSDYASIKITSDMRSIDDKYNIILKYAYLDWKPGFTQGHAKLRFGLQATQYIDQANKLWGRRYLEKTVSDKRKFLTSSDLGISTIVGFGHKSKYGFASLALLNGTSYTHVQELNNNKDFNLFSIVKPFKDIKAFSKTALMMQVYTGTQNNVLDDITTVDSAGTPWDTTVTAVESSDWKRQVFSVGGLLAWNSTLDFGFDMNFTTVGKGAGYDAVRKRGLSFFSSFYLKKLAAGSSFARSLNFFWRVDSYDPNTSNSADNETLNIFGVESTPVKGFKAALNYRLTTYADDDHDSHGMLYVNTLFKF